MNKEQIRTYLISNALNKAVEYAIEDTGCDLQEALRRVYASPVTKWLQDPEEDLYTRSPAYIYELIKRN